MCVIIAVYNGEEFLAEAIASALDQTCTDRSILVVDDGSLDGTARIAASFAGVRVIRQNNAGVSAARNLGLRESRSEYVVFLDCDDRLLPRALEIGATLLDERAELGFTYGFSEWIDASGKRVPTVLKPKNEANLRTLLGGDSLLPPASAMFRRSALEAVGGFDTRLAIAEDHELYLRIAAAFPIHCHNQVVVQYRMHGGNASTQSATRTLDGVLTAMSMRLADIRGKADHEAAYASGRRHWISLFGPGLSYELVKNLKSGDLRLAAKSLFMLLTLYPQGIVAYARDHLHRLRGESTA